jgi:glycosyltransferase involved in cell wall biosynthesis
MDNYLNRKKIIFITNILGNGGAGRVMATISNYLANKNYDIEVYSFLDDYDVYETNNKINNSVIKCKNKNTFIKKIERIINLRKIIKKNKKATIISFEYFVNMQTILATLFLDNKVIISERNDPSRHGNGFFINILRNILYKNTDILVCQTRDAKEYFPKSVQKKSVIIPNPIMSNLPNRFIGERKKELVTFSRIEKQKNLRLMIDAFALLNKDYPEYILSIYGDGREKQELINYAKRINISSKVNFYGFTSNIHSEIIDKTMFVSSSDYEGISNSMIEAMAIGLPCIVTDCPCGGARMMIDNGINGILVPTGDVNSLYREMKNLIKDKKLLSNLSINAVNIKERLKQETICEKWEELI